MASESIEALKQAVQDLRLGINAPPGSAGALATLAQKSRTDAEERALLAQPDILQTLITAVDASLDQSVEVAEYALRCIGNASIDNDDARTTITQIGFGWALRCLASGDSGLAWLTVKVLYNICSDHDGAQQQCYRDYIHYPLIRLYTRSDSAREEERSLLIDLLFWISGQREEVLAGNTETIPHEILATIVSLPCLHGAALDTEDLATVLEITLTFIRDTAVQDQLVGSGLIESVWQDFVYCETRSQENTDAHEVLRPLSSSLMWCLSDIAAIEHCSKHYDINDSLIMRLCMMIGTGQTVPVESTGVPSPSDQRAEHAGDRCIAAACQVVGNIIRTLTEEIVAKLVVAQKLHEQLWQRLTTPEDESDHDVEHSIAGFLIQLSRPNSEVRDIMGRDTNAHNALSRLCRSQTQEIKQDGLRLLRALGKECSNNQERFRRLAEEAIASDTTQDAQMLDAPA